MTDNNTNNKYQLGDAAVVQRGRLRDCAGRICRTCKYTGMLWLHLDKNIDSDLASVPFGPFFSSELSKNSTAEE